MEKVIKTLEISKDEDVLLILTSLLKDLLKDSLEVRNYFLKLLGFESMFLLLSTQWEDEKKNLTFLQNWFSIIYNSIQSKENRVYLERNMSKLSSRGEILDHCYNENSLLLVIHGFLGLSVQNQDIFQKTGTNLLTQQPVIIADAFFYDYLLSIVQRLHQKNLYLDVILQFLLYTSKVINFSSNNRILLSYCNSLKYIILMVNNLETPISFEQQPGSKDILSNTLALLAKELAIVGMSSEDLRLSLTLIMEKKQSNSFLRDLLLHTISHGNTPAYFQLEPFVDSASGRIAIGDYGRTAPPQTGYSFLAWINVSKYDKKNDIPIFTMVDNFGHERLSIFIDKETRCMFVRTVKSLVKLGNSIVPEKTWVHLAIVHQKPMLTASYAYFYINGVQVCVEKCSYMGQPGSITSVKTFIGSFSHLPTKDAMYSLKIGPVYFIGEYLMDAQTISIIHDIGFEYTGNWQGSWAAYLVGNEKLQKQASKIIDEELNSPIFNQLATFAMSPSKGNQTHHLDIPEENFWLSICAQNHIENISRLTLDELLKKNDDNETINRQNIIFNGGHAKNDCKTCKYATIEGSIISVCPKRIIEGVWTLGGCAILLRLVEDSESTEDMHKNLSILAGCVNNSWRNLADMERGQLYEILSFILRSKKHLLTIASLDVLLSLVGKSIDNSK